MDVETMVSPMRDSLARLLVPRKEGDFIITSEGGKIITTNVIMCSLATLWTAARVWSRYTKNITAFGVEDIICYAALFFEYGWTINLILLVLYGGSGQHVVDLDAETVEMFGKLFLTSQFFYALVVGLVKVSVTWNIKRIFEIQPGVTIGAYVTLVCSVAWMLQTIAVTSFLCRPISMNWVATPGGHCGDTALALTSVSVVDIITDFMILFLPLPSLFRLQIANAYKIPLFAIFGTVLITIALSAVRIYIVYTADFTDLSYAGVTSALVSSVQTGLTIMIASSPLLRPVFDRTVGSWLGLSLRTTNRADRYGGATGRSTGSRMANGMLNSRGFEQMKSRDQDLEWELAGLKDAGPATKVTVQAGRAQDSPTDGIMVTRSTVVNTV